MLIWQRASVTVNLVVLAYTVAMDTADDTHTHRLEGFGAMLKQPTAMNTCMHRHQRWEC